MIEEHDYLFKVVIVGNQGVGKSSLFLRYCDENFVDNYLPTIGVDFRFKRQPIQGSLCKLQIWDTAGQERFRTITSAYYRSSQAVLIVYDMTDPQSFQQIQDYWLRQAKNNVSDDAVLIIIGNKSDAECKVGEDIVQNFSRETGLKYFFVSAKTGQNVDKMFTELCEMLVEKEKLMQPIKNLKKDKKQKKNKIKIEEGKGRKIPCCNRL